MIDDEAEGQKADRQYFYVFPFIFYFYFYFLLNIFCLLSTVSANKGLHVLKRPRSTKEHHRTTYKLLHGFEFIFIVKALSRRYRGVDVMLVSKALLFVD